MTALVCWFCLVQKSMIQWKLHDIFIPYIKYETKLNQRVSLQFKQTFWLQSFLSLSRSLYTKLKLLLMLEKFKHKQKCVEQLDLDLVFIQCDPKLTLNSSVFSVELSTSRISFRINIDCTSTPPYIIFVFWKDRCDRNFF